jgi:hypothetical protein
MPNGVNVITSQPTVEQKFTPEVVELKEVGQLQDKKLGLQE